MKNSEKNFHQGMSDNTNFGYNFIAFLQSKIGSKPYLKSVPAGFAISGFLKEFVFLKQKNCIFKAENLFLKQRICVILKQIIFIITLLTYSHIYLYAIDVTDFLNLHCND